MHAKEIVDEKEVLLPQDYKNCTYIHHHCQYKLYDMNFHCDFCNIYSFAGSTSKWMRLREPLKQKTEIYYLDVSQYNQN